MKALMLITVLAAVPTLAFAAASSPAQPTQPDRPCQMMSASSHANCSQVAYQAHRQWEGGREGRK
jgi:putative hemolysin